MSTGVSWPCMALYRLLMLIPCFDVPKASVHGYPMVRGGRFLASCSGRSLDSRRLGLNVSGSSSVLMDVPCLEFTSSLVVIYRHKHMSDMHLDRWWVHIGFNKAPTLDGFNYSHLS
ncbi:hypothetical protein EYF80_016840 [Liparis tanakae]|uniref:Secreted protein n=1 Tax=Liparis tanakae TaxID=230148 RepID=A0A4Z2I566_9TELE|nr:hypothetical protein EYF80_016840 [Liparis tanakae]